MYVAYVGRHSQKKRIAILVECKLSDSIFFYSALCRTKLNLMNIKGDKELNEK